MLLAKRLVTFWYFGSGFGGFLANKAIFCFLNRIDPETDSLSDAIQANVLLQLEHLMEYPYIAKAVEDGELELHGWVYHFESGKVDFLKQESTA